MFIELLSKQDDRVNAWAHSRLLDPKHVNIDEVEYMDFSLQSLCRYTFKVEMARVMLDLIADFTKTLWSQSSRVIPITEMVIDHPNEVAQKLLDEAKEYALKGESQDLVRLRTPIMTRIGFCFSMDKRTLIGFLKSLMHYQPELFEIYGTKLMQVAGIDDLDKYTFGEVVSKSVVEALKMDPTEHQSPVSVEGVTSASYNYISQLKRHIGTQIFSELWITPYEKLSSILQSNFIKFYYQMSNDSWKYTILSHRSCWIADWNNWSNLVSHVFSENQIKDILPCKGDRSKCRYLNDQMARIEGRDPNLPCAIFMDDPSLIDKRESMDNPSMLYSAYRSILKQNKSNE